MPELTVDDLAREDVDNIAAIIAEDNLSAALQFFDTAASAFQFLSENPGAGPRFEPPIASLPGLRSWPITRGRNYLVFYLPLTDGARIVRVIHGARKLPSAIIRP
jgi:toxin ParE1/3/4